MSDLGISDEDVQIFKEWLEKQTYLLRRDDYWYRCFIRVCNNSVQEAKIRYDNYCKAAGTLAQLIPVWDIRNPNFLSTARTVPMSSINSDSTAYQFIRYADPDGSKIDGGYYFLRIFAYLHLKMMKHELPENFVYIFDLEHANLSHAVAFNPTLLEKMAYMASKCSPVKVKGLHFINMGPYMEVPVKLFKQFASSKIQTRWYIHKDISSLLKEIPPECLPLEYGGTNKSIAEFNEEVIAEFTDQRETLLEEKIVIEDAFKLRPTDPDELPGTFRQLAVD